MKWCISWSLLSVPALHTSSSLLLTVPPTRWMHGMLRRPDMQAVLDLPQCCAIYVNWCLLFCAYIPEIGTLFLKDPQWQAGTFFNYCVKATGIVKHSLHVCCAALAAVPGLKLPILLILLPRLSVITLYTLVTAGDDNCDGDVMVWSSLSSLQVFICHMETLKAKIKDVDVHYDWWLFTPYLPTALWICLG